MMEAEVEVRTPQAGEQWKQGEEEWRKKEEGECP